MTLARLEYVAALVVCVVLGWIHRDAIDWARYALLFAGLDLVGTLPGLVAHAAAKGRPVHPAFTVVYNSTHNAIALGLIAAAWCLAAGPEWALLALPAHLCADRGLLGNGFKSADVPFAQAQGAPA